MSRNVIILGHGYSSRLCMIRSLGEFGYDITVVIIGKKNKQLSLFETRLPIDCYSKYVNRYYYCDSSSEKIINLLLTKCKITGEKPVIIPDSDFTAFTIDNNIDILKDYFLFPHIDYTVGAVANWMDKGKQKDLARSIGLNVANSCKAHIVEGQYYVSEDVKYPCFVKPEKTIVGGKIGLKKCNNKEELVIHLQSLCNIKNCDFLVEDYLNITNEYAIVGFSDGKNVVIPGVIKITEMAQGFHYGVAKQGTIMPNKDFSELIEKFRKLITVINFVGLFDIDFFECNDTYYFGELNLRFGGSGYAFTKAGINLPAMFVNFISGEYGKINYKQQLEEVREYTNERMCIEDWYSGFITKKQLINYLNDDTIMFVQDKSDPKPGNKMKELIFRRNIKKMLKKILK